MVVFPTTATTTTRAHTSRLQQCQLRTPRSSLVTLKNILKLMESVLTSCRRCPECLSQRQAKGVRSSDTYSRDWAHS